MKALILAGGFGTRMRPLTNHVPKSLLPICNRPFLEHQVRLLAAHGITEAILLTGYLPDEFGPFAQQMRALGVTLQISTESKPLGTAGAVRSQLAALDGTTIVFNGDVLTDLDLSALVEFHRARHAAVTITLTHVEDARPYGLVPMDEDGRVKEFLEKQPIDQPGWINAGTYVLEPSVLDEVPEDEFWQFEQQLFPSLLAAGTPIYGFRSDSYWLDIGNPERYLQAHFDVLAGRARAVVDGRLVAADSALDDGTRIRGPVLLSHAAVEPGVALGPLVSLAPRVRIGEGAVIERSVLHEGAEVGAGAVVRDTIVGRGAAVEAGVVCEGQVLA